MPQGRPYCPRLDQPALTAAFDFEAALAACQSFDKCHRELRSLLQQAARITPGFDPGEP